MSDIQSRRSFGYKKITVEIQLLVILLVCTVGSLSACSKDTVMGFKENQVLRVDTRYVTIEQANVLMCGLQKKYENMFGTEAWSKQFGDSTLDQYIQEQIKNQLVQLYTMSLLAEQKKVTLNEEEQEKAKQAATTFYEQFSKEQLKAIGFDKKDVLELYTQYAVAEKVYEKITDSVDKEISDDQARMIDVQVIFFNTSKEDRELTQEERESINSKAYEAWEKANAGTDFETLAAAYNEGTQIEYHIGRGEMEDAFDKVAFNLTNNQVSAVVEGEKGLYIIKCISNYNQTETDANKLAIYEEECAEVFNKEYDKFVKDLKIKLNDKAWKKVTITKEILPEVDFVKIYNETIIE